MQDCNLSLMNSIRSIARAIRSQSNKAQSELKLNAAQIFIIREVLSSKNGIGINDLANKTHTHQSTVSSVVSRLIKNGWLTKATDDLDRRHVLITPTSMCLEKFNNQPTLVQDQMISALKEMSEDERVQFITLLEKFVTLSKIKIPEAPMFDEED